MKRFNFKRKYPLKKITTMAIGGPASVFVSVKSENELRDSLEYAHKNDLKWYVIGDGSNLVPADRGYNGLIIKNEISQLGFRKKGVVVGAGHKLLDLIWKLDKSGLSGMEKM